MVPIDEYNRFTITADANKLLVPTYPKQNEGESTEDYQQRVQKDYYDVSSISGIFKSFGDAPGGFRRSFGKYSGAWVPSTSTTTSSPCVPVTTTSRRTKATESTSPWVQASR